MATIKNTETILQKNLGWVYVQPSGEVPPLESLAVIRHPRYGVTLADRDGVRVSPKSRRLGFQGSRPGQAHTLVCDDDVTDETREVLVSTGYLNVIMRP